MKLTEYMVKHYLCNSVDEAEEMILYGRVSCGTFNCLGEVNSYRILSDTNTLYSDYKNQYMWFDHDSETAWIILL